MAEQMVRLMRANDAPPEQFERLGLPATGPVEPAHLLLRVQHDQVTRARTPLPDTDELPAGAVGVHTALSDLLADPDAVAAIESAVPGLLENPRVAALGRMSLREVAAVAPGVLDAGRLRALAAALASTMP